MFRFVRAWLIYTWGGLHRYFGNQNNMRSEHEAAVRYFTRAYNIDPTWRRARLERGILLYRELQRLDEALVDFDALLADDPTYGPALFNRAMLAQEAGRYQDALADLEAYLRLPGEEYQAEATRIATFLRQLIEEKDGG